VARGSVAPVEQPDALTDVHEFELDEPGFEGVLRLGESGEGRRVVLSGTRQDGVDTTTPIQKDIPADRDPRLAELVARALAGDAGAPVEILAHVGVLSPE
jgi:hypothetical protein